MPKAQEATRFKLEKSTNAGITFLTLHGILDQAFEGRKIAESVHTKKVVLNLRAVRRFASWGMSEWMDFMRVCADRDLYFVECSTYAVSQMSLVTGLMAHGKLVSFYAPYRCGSCGEEFEILMVVPIDRAAIRDLANSEQVCGTCNGSARLDKYPANSSAAIADRPPFDIDDEVLAFMREKLKYNLVPDRSRFRALRETKNDYTYMRLSGNVAAMNAEQLARLSTGTTVVDLAAITYDSNDLSAWRSYVKGALATATSVQLLDCPAGFLERALQQDDIDPKLKVRTFAAAYQCATCHGTTVQMVDVAENLEQLSEGLLPPAQCSTCRAPIATYLGNDQAILRKLPARARDPLLDKFVDKARTDPADKLEDCLVARAPVAPKKSYSRQLAVLFAVLVLGGGVAIGASKLLGKDDPPPQVVVTPPVSPQKPATTFQRPEWIISDTPSSAFCHDMINRLMCVGVSSYRPNRNEAVAEANDTALEELVNAVGLKISSSFFKETALADYSDARAKALSTLQTAETDRTSKAYAAALDDVRKARKRVVEVFQMSGGAAVPVQRSDWFWEEYNLEKGPGTEVLVFVRYDVSLDEVKALVAKYSETTPVLGNIAMTAFPSLGWRYADFAGGAVLTKVGSPLAKAGVEPKQIVMNVGDQRVSDAAVFARSLLEWSKAGGDLKLTVKSGESAPRVVDVRR
ncbi:MAG: hypothetical protein ABI867_05200 [Kofleriaceae bacterium]